MKIIRIDGFRGIVTAVFIAACLFSGFVISPGVLAMYLWNKYLVVLLSFPVLNVFQGVLLWSIIALSYLIITKGQCAVSFKQTKGLSEPEMNMILKNARIYSKLSKISREVQKSDKFEKSFDNVVSLNKKNIDEIDNIISSFNDKKDENISNVD